MEPEHAKRVAIGVHERCESGIAEVVRAIDEHGWGSQVFTPERGHDLADIITHIAEALTNREVEDAVLLAPAGTEACIAANRFPELRAIASRDELILKRSRHYERSNVLCLSGELMSEMELAQAVIDWLYEPKGETLSIFDEQVGRIEHQLKVRHSLRDDGAVE